MQGFIVFILPNLFCFMTTHSVPKNYLRLIVDYGLNAIENFAKWKDGDQAFFLYCKYAKLWDVDRSLSFSKIYVSCEWDRMKNLKGRFRVPFCLLWNCFVCLCNLMRDLYRFLTIKVTFTIRSRDNLLLFCIVNKKEMFPLRCYVNFTSEEQKKSHKNKHVTVKERILTMGDDLWPTAFALKCL